MKPLDRGQLFCIKCDDVPWQPSTFAKDVSVKNIAIAGGLEMQIVKFEPGAALPVHDHDIPEFIYVLEGDLCIAGQTLGPGWASIASEGSVHSDVHSMTGCTFVLVDRPL
ncbi:MAG TPA: cupin domain-containing protein [Rhodanobacteraceae bacterium]